jgi:hypothetical protein
MELCLWWIEPILHRTARSGCCLRLRHQVNDLAGGLPQLEKEKQQQQEEEVAVEVDEEGWGQKQRKQRHSPEISPLLQSTCRGPSETRERSTAHSQYTARCAECE